MDVDGCCAPEKVRDLQQADRVPGRTALPAERAERDGEANRGLARKPFGAFLEPKQRVEEQPVVSR